MTPNDDESDATALRLEILRFAKLVKVMRAIQARASSYDRTRETLREARDMEARVDRAVEWILHHRSDDGRQAVQRGLPLAADREPK